ASDADLNLYSIVGEAVDMDKPYCIAVPAEYYASYMASGVIEVLPGGYKIRLMREGLYKIFEVEAESDAKTLGSVVKFGLFCRNVETVGDLLGTLSDSG